MHLTVESVLALGLCDEWDRERLERYARARGTRVTLASVLTDSAIDLGDRLWLGTTLLPDARWGCMDRAARLYAASALRAAELTEHADELTSLRCVVDEASAAGAAGAAWWRTLKNAWCAADLATHNQERSVQVVAARGAVGKALDASEDAVTGNAHAAAMHAIQAARRAPVDVAWFEEVTQLRELIRRAEESHGTGTTVS